MGTEFERQRQAAELAKGLHPTPPARATVEGDVVVPVLQAVAVAGAMGLGGGGFALLFGASWTMAGQLAGGGFLAGLCGCVLLFVFQHRAILTTPSRVMWQQQALLQPSPAPEEEPEWRVIRPYRGRPALAATTLDHTVQALGPEVASEIEELYTFLCRVWPTGNVSRAHCRGLGFTRATWERLVGGRRGKGGQESGRGLLDRAGAVENTPNGWEIACPLDQALTINEQLLSYAEARAELVRPGRDRTGQDGTATPPGTGRPTGRG